VGSLERRLFDLEASLLPREVTSKSEAGKKVRAVLQELARLKASCATRHTGGNIPLQLLGPGYTHRELVSLAASRASEAGAFPEDEIEAATVTMLSLGESRR
jgi:hypothetical protein